MSVYEITVNGHPDHVADLVDPDPWVEAAQLVEDALAGRPTTVEAVRRNRLVDCNPIVWFNANQVVDDA